MDIHKEFSLSDNAHFSPEIRAIASKAEEIVNKAFPGITGEVYVWVDRVRFTVYMPEYSKTTMNNRKLLHKIQHLLNDHLHEAMKKREE